MRFTRTVTRLSAASIIGLAVMALPQAAVGASPPALAPPTIGGVPVVGQTLTALAVATGDPAPTLTYQWLNCHPEKSPCHRISGATGTTYVVDAAYLGRRLAVRVTATNSEGKAEERSAPTLVVTAATSPEPAPAPTPAPTPDPTPGETPDEDTPQSFDKTSSSPVAPTGDAPGEPATSLEREQGPLRYLRPFPVVRIKGTLVDGGARVTRLGIRAPATARVTVRCTGARCRYFSRTTGSRRVRPLERFLSSGTRITIRIRRPGLIGKHVKIVIRDGRPPRRRDACLMPGSSRPVACPVP